MMKLEFIFNPEIRLKSAFEPVWKSQIDRWYQLDETSFALCEAVFSWQESKQLPLFDDLIFISEGGSNLADAEFVNTIPVSPAKFVYTLANIAPSVVSYLLKWSGPVMVLGQAVHSLELAVSLARAQVSVQGRKTFILQSSPRLNDDGYRVVNGLHIS